MCVATKDITDIQGQFVIMRAH